VPKSSAPRWQFTESSVPVFSKTPTKKRSFTNSVFANLRFFPKFLSQYHISTSKSAPPIAINIVVNNTIIHELKAVQKIEDLHQAQLLTYLRLAKKPLGLLLNFNVPRLKEGIRRLINKPF